MFSWVGCEPLPPRLQTFKSLATSGTHRFTLGHKILRGARKFTVAHVKKLAAIFHLSPSYFIA